MLHGDLNGIGLVLASFKDNLLLRNHWTKSFNSWLMMHSIVPNFLAENKRLLSSEKWRTIDFEKVLCRPFI